MLLNKKTRRTVSALLSQLQLAAIRSAEQALIALRERSFDRLADI